jgi:uncharacterized protein YsxB (DUF464 family)
MINVKIKRNADGLISEFSIKGHANYADYGKDIVCSAVSAISIGIYNSIATLVGIELPVRQGKSGELACWIPMDYPEKKQEQIQLLLEAMVVSLKDIEKEYGSFIKITEKSNTGGGSSC